MEPEAVSSRAWKLMVLLVAAAVLPENHREEKNTHTNTANTPRMTILRARANSSAFCDVCGSIFWFCFGSFGSYEAVKRIFFAWTTFLLEAAHIFSILPSPQADKRKVSKKSTYTKQQ